MKKWFLLVSFACFLTGNHDVFAYKPVFLIHGLLRNEQSMRTLSQEIRNAHPGTIVYTTEKYNGWKNLESLWNQIDEIGKEVLTVCKEHRDGIHLLGYSQGGLTARGIIQTLDNHNIKSFISIAAPQAGVFGSGIFQNIYPNANATTLSNRIYNRRGQENSIGSIWNDPYRQNDYLKYSTFLPYINNEIKTVNSTRFRENLINIDQMVLIGGPDDEALTPWQTSLFGYYEGEDKEIVPYNQRKIYRNDDIGLRQLKEEGRLEVLTYKNVKHANWILNKRVLEDGILPFLN